MFALLVFTFVVLAIIAAAAADVSPTLRTTLPNVPLQTAGKFAILSGTGITDVSPSVIVGDIGTSPITGAALLVPCTELVGKMFVVDAGGFACSTINPSYLTTAIADMVYAYNQVALLKNPNFLDLAAGHLGGLTLAPGLYSFSGSVDALADFTIQGTDSSLDKWIFQVAGTLNVASGVRVTMSRGATARKVTWQVAEAVTFDTTSHMEGVVLGKTLIAINTGASVTGRLLAQTAVTLQMATVVAPQL